MSHLVAKLSASNLTGSSVIASCAQNTAETEMELRSPIPISEKLLEHDAIDIEDLTGPLKSLV